MIDAFELLGFQLFWDQATFTLCGIAIDAVRHANVGSTILNVPACSWFRRVIDGDCLRLSEIIVVG